MSTMKRTDNPTNYNTMSGYQISCINQQEHIYDAISEKPTNTQPTEVKIEKDKKQTRCRWPLLLTVILTALIATTLSTSITYIAMKISTELERLNATFNIKQHDLKRLKTTFESKRQEFDQLNTAYKIKQRDLEQVKTMLETHRKDFEQLNTTLNMKKQELEELKVKHVALKSGICEPPWMFFNCHCYYFSNDFLNWRNAQSYCLQRKSNLVKIDDIEENSWLLSVLKDKSIKDQTWIGANDITQPDNWVWVSDNSTLQFTAWGGREPTGFDKNTGKQEDCGTFYEKVRGWNDVNCLKVFSYICEKPYN